MRTLKPCPPELLDFCSRELDAIQVRIQQSLEHLSEGETLAAAGAADGLQTLMASVVSALQLIARVYPSLGKKQGSLSLT